MTELNILFARYIATIANYYYLCANDYKILDYQNIFQKKFYLIIYKQCVCMFKNIKKIIILKIIILKIIIKKISFITIIFFNIFKI